MPPKRYPHETDIHFYGMVYTVCKIISTLYICREDFNCLSAFLLQYQTTVHYKCMLSLCVANSKLLHRKKKFTSFPSPAGMSLIKLLLGRNNLVMTSLFPPRESLVMTSRLGTGNSRTFFTVYNGN
jgi:hypothetical protein